MPQNQTCKRLSFGISPSGSCTLRSKPLYVSVGVEGRFSHHRMGAAKRDHSPGEAMSLRVLFEKAPIHPADGVILAVRIIVTSLRPTKFVSTEQHRNSKRNKEGEEKILDQAISQGFHVGGIAWAFNSAIVAVIGIGAVASVLTVFLVVLLFIGDQVI